MSLANPDASDGGAFTPLERFVMELFRVINANDGSGSVPMNVRRELDDSTFNGVVTPHGPASMSSLHWKNPAEFDPDRYKTVPLTSDDGETRSKAAGLAKCPFDHSEFAVKDGRDVKITNSPFGADYPVVDGVAHPLADTAGYSPFGFGYRRCPGELMTVEFMKEFLRRVWSKKLSFTTLDIENPDLVPTNPKNVLIDNIAFVKTT
jgi:cytochrome P450